MKPINKRIVYVALFAVAMGFFESAVVIYLREIFYPDGFAFPLVPIPDRLALVEVLREAATVVMLISVGYLAGSTGTQRFAWFVLTFAIWDLCYYLFLFLFAGWPQSIFTWDILFLIPVPWVGPVWAPCLLCFVMIVGAVAVIRSIHHDSGFRVSRAHWVFAIAGAATCILSFMWDYLFHSNSSSSVDGMFGDMRHYIPQRFNVLLFFCGFALICYPVIIHFTNKPHHANQ